MKFFPSWPDEEKNELSFFTSEGKIKPRIRILARKRPRGTAPSKWLCPALTSSYESYDKNLKTPQKR